MGFRGAGGVGAFWVLDGGDSQAVGELEGDCLFWLWGGELSVRVLRFEGMRILRKPWCSGAARLFSGIRCWGTVCKTVGNQQL